MSKAEGSQPSFEEAARELLNEFKEKWEKNKDSALGRSLFVIYAMMSIDGLVDRYAKDDDERDRLLKKFDEMMKKELEGYEE